VLASLTGFPAPTSRLGEASSQTKPAITRLVGAILLEQNDEWAFKRARYITLESIAPVSDDPIVGLPIVCLPIAASCPIRLYPEIVFKTDGQLHHAWGHDQSDKMT